MHGSYKLLEGKETAVYWQINQTQHRLQTEVPLRTFQTETTHMLKHRTLYHTISLSRRSSERGSALLKNLTGNGSTGSNVSWVFISVIIREVNCLVTYHKYEHVGLESRVRDCMVLIGEGKGFRALDQGTDATRIDLSIL